MGFFDGARDHKAGGEGGFKPGVYQDLLVTRVHVHRGHHGLRFRVDVKTLSDGTPNHETLTPAKAGEMGSVGIKIEGEYRASALGEVNGIIGALLGYDLDQTNARLVEIESESEKAITPDQPHRGKVMRGTVYEKITRKGNKMIKIKLEPWDGRKASVGAGDMLQDRETQPTGGGFTAPPAPAAPAAPPPAPAGDWFDFPAGDPRQGVQQYNAAGEVRPVA